MLFCKGIDSTTFIASWSDSLYRISNSVTLKLSPKLPAVEGKGTFKSILFTLFSIKATSVLL